MAAYATVADYEGIYGECDDSRLETLLLAASDSIDWEYHKRGLPLPVDSTDAYLASKVKYKTCELAHRYLESNAASEVTSQWSMTAGPYTQSGTYAFTGSRLNLNRVDLRDLGLYGGKAGFSHEREVADD